VIISNPASLSSNEPEINAKIKGLKKPLSGNARFQSTIGGIYSKKGQELTLYNLI
jgi:hypothetical protein